MTRQRMAGQARVGGGRTVGTALAVTGTALALAAGAAAAQDSTRAGASPTGNGSGRRAVDALTARSAAFRDTVTRALGASDFDDGSPVSRAWADRLAGGITISVSQPTGAFKHFAGVGVGFAANGEVTADRSGVLGLRVEGGAQNYGRSAGPAQTLQGIVFANTYRQVTSNDIYWGSIGPQVSLPFGPVRPYAFGTVGVANFATTSRLIGLGLDGRQSRTLDISDLRSYATTRGYGGGLRFRVPRGPGRTALSVDVGARAHLIRSAQYLVPGALSSPTADPTLRAIRGQANFVTYHLGVSAGGR